MTAFPPLAAVFLTYFDDIKGQSVLYYSSLPGKPYPSLHTSLPLLFSSPEYAVGNPILVQ